MQIEYEYEKRSAEIVPFSKDGLISTYDQHKVRTFAETLADGYGKGSFLPEYMAIRNEIELATAMLEHSGLAASDWLGVTQSAYIKGREPHPDDDSSWHGLRMDAIWLDGGWYISGGYKVLLPNGAAPSLPLVHMTNDRIRKIEAAQKDIDLFSRERVKVIGSGRESRTIRFWDNPHGPSAA